MISIQGCDDHDSSKDSKEVLKRCRLSYFDDACFERPPFADCCSGCSPSGGGGGSTCNWTVTFKNVTAGGEFGEGKPATNNCVDACNVLTGQDLPPGKKIDPYKYCPKAEIEDQ